MKENNKNNIQIQFPNTRVMILVAAICTIVKLYGGCSCSWLHVLLTIPISVYMGWCLFWVVIAILLTVLARISKGVDSK